MTRRRKITAAVLLVMANVFLLLWLFRVPDPVYEGRHVSEWFALSLSGSPNAADGKDAVYKLGTDALPFLISRVERRESAIRDFYNRSWTNLTFAQKFLPRPCDVVAERSAALGHIELMGRHAAAAAPAIMRLARHQMAALQPTKGSWPPGGASLDETLAALAFVGNPDKQVILTLLDAEPFNHVATPWHERHRALMQLAPAVDNALPEIIAATDRPETRLLAVRLLRLVVEDKPEVIPVLFRVVEVDDPRASPVAIYALSLAQGQAEMFVPVLINALANGIHPLGAGRRGWPPGAPNAYCESAAMCLAALSPRWDNIVPALMDALDNPNPRIRAGACAGISMVPGKPLSALARLRELSERDEDEVVRYHAARAATRLGFNIPDRAPTEPVTPIRFR